ncbi:hypothetical protein LCGC14_1021430 [marine sediment metagenome]|uniref:Metallophosphoesterase n=2 Tax=root TaxID=1 RepID=A0A831QQV9_9FLAO|nr:metallophosphoesterase [Pricia sp.]HEA22798.1 metallophosphoesterase [Pricia antarctica]
MIISKKLDTVSIRLIVRILLTLFTAVTLVSCSGSSDDKVLPTDENSGGAQIDSAAITIFTVIGDVPYTIEQKEGLVNLIDAHNAKSKSEFVVHVGDIKPGGDVCDESVYEEVSGLLRKFESPTFIILGDNEFNDCDNPEDGLALWKTYFLNFNTNWNFPYVVENQEERPENFAWVENRVLFLGLNLVGSSVHDQMEWDNRLADDAEWIEQQFELQKDNIEVAVLFGHANMTELNPEKFEPFTNRFRKASVVLDKPVLYMQGDGHFWFENKPWPEQNIVRVQIEGGANAVQVTVNPNLENPFNFDREFLN